MASTRRRDCGLTRRGFLGMAAVGGGAIAIGRPLALAAEGKTDVWVLHGQDKKKLMAGAMKIIQDNGGFGKSVKKLTLKINAAWFRTPEQAANTNPELVDAFLKGCKDLGIKDVLMPENPVDAAKSSFTASGLLEVAKSNGANMIDLRSDEKLLKEIELPKAKSLKKALVGKDFVETDALVNMPVAKHHSGATLTMAMKNWMGSVQDRGFWHRNNLHQCIADYSTFIQPTWTIIDAMKIMLDRGPKGPSKNMKQLDLLIVSRDQVAADAYTSTLFPGQGPDKIKYLLYAGEMKIGTVDLAQIAVHKLEV